MRRRLVPTLATVLATTALAGSAGCSAFGTDSAVAGGQVTTGPSQATPAVASSSATTDPAVAVREAVTELVKNRTTAVANHDQKAWLATLRDPQSSFGAEQAALFDRVSALPLRFTTRSVQVEPSSAADGTWVANVKLAYRFDGYDRGDRDFSLSYVVAQTPAGWRFSGTGPGTSDVQPFDLPDLNVAKSDKTLVLGDVPKASLQAYLALADTAHDRIQAVWGTALPAVVVAPKSSDELIRQLGLQSTAGFDQVAAVTQGPLTSGSPALTDRVFLNPDVFTKLTGTGRGVVLTHELTHVTVRGTTSRSVPLWLAEGFADDVAFKPVGLPPRTVAADLLNNVRNGSAPTALPSTDEFDPSKGSIAPAYNAAWLAIYRIRQTRGQDAVVAFYRAVSGDEKSGSSTTSADDLARQAFQDVLKTTQDAFVAEWSQYIKRLAR